MDTQLQIDVLTRRKQPGIEAAGQAMATLVRYGLAVLLGVTAVAKLASGEAFIDAVRGYGIVPLPAADVVASIVVVGELALAVWLGIGRAKRGALWTAAAAFVALGALIAIAAWRGATGDCGCFAGVAESAIGPGAILRNAALAAIAINAAVVERPPARFNS